MAKHARRAPTSGRDFRQDILVGSTTFKLRFLRNCPTRACDPPSIVVIISLLVPPLIIRILHAIVKPIDIVDGIIPAVLDILRHIFDLLDLLAGPTRRILWEILNIIDGIVEALVHTIAKVFHAPNLLARPARGVLGEVGDIVAEFVDTVLDAVLVALKVVL